ncbi:hypothetical protein [Streptomyces sp. NBC_01264]|uniref:hypothetical protein n=1 Tax=Streptomyces sp. NBC_01264 TaxID=2903804 RepID=UPI002255F3FF|nr:hypothetical protein [Streptomyces sp. NBC_01264]MCX4778118.1 hypothetical protein [Streptomyces sp. NBC_01264]
MTAQPTPGTFGVYCAGEQIDGTDIGFTYVYISTPLGKVRMTSEEARQVGQSLIAAADYNHALDDEDVAPAFLGKRYVLTYAHLEAVAAVYRNAVSAGEGPTKAVARYFGVAHSTAAKWAARARKQGSLQATSKGVAS